MINKLDYEAIYSSLPIVLSVNLYKHNYFDNLIVATLKNNVTLFRNDKQGISVMASDILQIIDQYLYDEFNRTDVQPVDMINSTMTSVYQMVNLLKYFYNTKVVNINILKETNYSKVIRTDMGDIISFPYKIDKIQVHYDRILNDKEIELFNNLLRDIGIVKTIKPLSTYVVYLNDYLSIIDNMNDKFKAKYEKILELNHGIFAEKLKVDNPFTTIITDF